MTIEEKSYVFGLLMTDGNLYINPIKPNKGRVSLEISERDSDIVEKLFRIIPKSKISNRTRNTNFSKDYTSIRFCNCQKQFRDELIMCGFPVKEKTKNACLPTFEYTERDFWRGVIDGDGSLGLSASINAPFISLTTKSEFLCQGYLNFLKTLGIERHPSRNTRDDIYNIMLSQESAIIVANVLYKGSSIYMNRKFSKFLEIESWKRPLDKKRRIYEETHWSKEEVLFLLNHTKEESEKELNKTPLQIKTKIANLKSRGTFLTTNKGVPQK